MGLAQCDDNAIQIIYVVGIYNGVIVPSILNSGEAGGTLKKYSNITSLARQVAGGNTDK